MLGVRISPNPKPFAVIPYGQGCRVQVNSEEVWFIEGDLLAWVPPHILLKNQKRVHQALGLRKYTVSMGILKEASQLIRAKT